jgi:mono/diheme cytochrome c family protein
MLKTSRILCAIAATVSLITGASLLRSAPPAQADKIDYATAVRPIFEANCSKCHLNGVRKGSMDLGSLPSLLKGGESEEPAVIPHNSGESRLIKLITSDDPDLVMPKKGNRLSPDQIATIKAWIDRGAPWGDAPGAEPKYVAPLEPRKVALPEGTEGNPIDRLLSVYFKSHQVAPVDSIDDRTYARRVYLDIVGLIPTAQQVETFVNDSSPDKREKLVNSLLANNEKYAENWMSFWNDVLRNDYTGTGYIDGGRKQITAWLFKALYNNMPYDKFVASLVNPTPDCEGFINGIEWRGAVSASQRKEVQAAQNVTQIFLGLNFKCNSCHDSFISDWKLADSYGLAGVFADKPMEMYRCEKDTGQIAKIKFLYPQLGSIDESAPRTAKMKQLAALMTDKRDGRLTRTIVNRLWARFMGQGIVEPVDEMDQRPWDEDLLDWLASDFADHGYDVKRTITLILTSRAYQMPTVGMHEAIDSKYVFRGPVVRRMSAEQFVDAISEITGQWHGTPAAGEALSLPQFALPAQWIWDIPDAKEKAPPETIELKKEFELSEKPSDAIVAVDADNSYELVINGKLASRGKDFAKPAIINISKFLARGTNRFEVWATNDPMPDPKPSPSPDNPAGFWLLASMHDHDGNLVEIGTDKSWLWRKDESDDWKPAFEVADAADTAWSLTRHLTATKKTFTYCFEHTRAVWAKNDTLMTALGRPNREIVVTHRFSPATMLQMLELTNGQMLSDSVQKGAKRWMGRKFESSDAMIVQIFRESLGRDPSPQEMAMSLKLVQSPAQQQGVEDLLWSILMLPEFQLVY